MKTFFAFLATACACGGASAGQATIEFLPEGFLLSGLSFDGTAGAGNVVGDGSFEPFRWAPLGGVVRLGGATVPVLGNGAGAPAMSDDGLRLSATILSTDGRATMGIWDSVVGWIEAMPPLPPDGVEQDSYYGAAWGLSGDGTTVTGHYYSNWSGPTRARPSTWSQTTGMIALPSNAGVSCRVNASNFDGTIVGGWEDHGGPWWPTVWRNGVKTNLNDADGGGGGQVRDVSGDGAILAGSEYQESILTRAATIWTWNGSAYDMQNIGTLPGTVFNSGQAYFQSIADDGSIAVGSNLYTFSPGAARDGIVWTPAGGLVNATDYITSLGLSPQIPADMDIREMGPVSPNGRVIAGIGLLANSGQFQTFVIHLPPLPCPGDADGSRAVDFVDVLTVLANFGATGDPYLVGDSDGSGIVDFGDVLTTLANFNAECP